MRGGLLGFYYRFARRKSRNKWQAFLDHIIFFIGVLGPILTLPQLIKVWAGKDASGLSMMTWSLWLFVDSIWILYGFAHRIYPIVISHGAYMLVQTGVVAGIILYG